MPTNPVALLVIDDTDTPSVRLLRSRRAIDRAVSAGGLVIGADGHRVGEADEPGDQERLENAHAALAERFGLPEPDLPNAGAHVAALAYLGRLGRLFPKPPPEGEPDPLERSVYCFFCVLNNGIAGCPGCRVAQPPPLP